MNLISVCKLLKAQKTIIKFLQASQGSKTLIEFFASVNKLKKHSIHLFASLNKLKNYLIHLCASLKNLKDEFNFLQGFKRMNVFSEALKNLKKKLMKHEFNFLKVQKAQ